MQEYKIKDIRIENLNLSNRTYNCLKKMNINMLSELLLKPFLEIKNIRGIGEKSITEICLLKQKFENVEIISTYNNVELLYFMNSSNEMVHDIKIEDLKLSNRSLNALKLADINYASQLITLSIQELYSLSHMGNKSVNEIYSIIKMLKSNAQVFQKDNLTDEYSLNIDNIIAQLCSDWGMIDRKHTKDNILKVALKEALYNNTLPHDHESLYELYKSGYLKEFYKNHLLDLIKANILKCDNLLSTEPLHLQSSDSLIRHVLNELIVSNVVELVSDTFHIKKESLLVKLNKLEESRAKDILLERLNAKTLDEIGKKYNLTRERVRQIVNTLLMKLRGYNKKTKQVDGVDEDKYASLFQDYKFTIDQFTFVLNLPIQVFYYFSNVFKIGEKEFFEILNDGSVEITIREKVQQYINSSIPKHLTINDEKIELKTISLVKYVIKTYFKNDGSYNDFFNKYEWFLKFYSLNTEDDFTIHYRTYEYKLRETDFILWKFNKRLRYYPIHERNYYDLYKELNLDKYENLVISTLKLYLDHRKLMDFYDIHDEYELHNLLKKTINKVKYPTVKFSKMPVLLFGTGSLLDQIKKEINQNIYMNTKELSMAIENKYGIRRETIVGSYMKYFDSYLKYNTHKIDKKNSIIKTTTVVHTVKPVDEKIDKKISNSKIAIHKINEGFDTGNSIVNIDEIALVQKQKETLEAQNLLNNIFLDNEDSYDNNSWTGELSVSHINLLEYFIDRKNCSYDEFDRLCKNLELMIDGTIEYLNEFSYEQFNEPVIEELEDMIYFNTDLIKVLLNR